MPSFLLFDPLGPIEVEYTSLHAGGETRYVIRAGDKGGVIRKNKEGVWEQLGKVSIKPDLIQKIGSKIVSSS